MAMSDTLGDMLTRIRNAQSARQGTCVVPASKLRGGVLEVLKREGYIEGYQVASEGCRSNIVVQLKYGPEGEQVINTIKRFSTPGCRRYRGVDQIPKVRGGLGIAVVSTNKGVLSDRECRAQRVGGEVLCTVD